MIIQLIQREKTEARIILTQPKRNDWECASRHDWNREMGVYVCVYEVKLNITGEPIGLEGTGSLTKDHSLKEYHSCN